MSQCLVDCHSWQSITFIFSGSQNIRNGLLLGAENVKVIRTREKAKRTASRTFLNTEIFHHTCRNYKYALCDNYTNITKQGNNNKPGRHHIPLRILQERVVWKSAKHVQTSLNSGPAILFTVDTNSHVISLVLLKIIQLLTKSRTINVFKYVWNIILIQYSSQKDVPKCMIFLFIKYQALKNFNHVTLREWNKHGAGINLPLTTHTTICGDKSLFFTITSNISVIKIDLIMMRSVRKCMYDSSSSFWWVQWTMQSWKCDTFLVVGPFLSKKVWALFVSCHLWSTYIIYYRSMLLHYSVHKTKMFWCWHGLACSWRLKNENDLTRWVRLRVLLLDEFHEGRWQHRSFHVHISRHWLHQGKKVFDLL